MPRLTLSMSKRNNEQRVNHSLLRTNKPTSVKLSYQLNFVKFGIHSPKLCWINPATRQPVHQAPNGGFQMPILPG